MAFRSGAGPGLGVDGSISDFGRGEPVLKRLRRDCRQCSGGARDATRLENPERSMARVGSVRLRTPQERICERAGPCTGLAIGRSWIRCQDWSMSSASLGAGAPCGQARSSAMEGSAMTARCCASVSTRHRPVKDMRGGLSREARRSGSPGLDGGAPEPTGAGWTTPFFGPQVERGVGRRWRSSHTLAQQKQLGNDRAADWPADRFRRPAWLLAWARSH